MWLPTQAQVNAASRNAGSLAAGMILAFGLSSKFDPDTVKNIIAATGTLVNDALVLVGLVTPFLTMYFSSRSANPKEQAKSITASVPGTVVVTSAEIAKATPDNPNIVSNADVKVVSK